MIEDEASAVVGDAAPEEGVAAMIVVARPIDGLVLNVGGGAGFLPRGTWISPPWLDLGVATRSDSRPLQAAEGSPGSSCRRARRCREDEGGTDSSDGFPSLAGDG
jgi:hypothetical protein